MSLLLTIHDMEQDEVTLDQKHSIVRKWTHLPSDILEMIMKRLKLIDYLRIRAVCSPWKDTVTKAIANKHCHPLPELPLVFLKSIEKSILPSRFFSISTEQACSLKSKSLLVPEIQHGYHGIVEGWIILSVRLFYGTIDAILFLNPVTNDVVTVPSPLNFPSNSPRSDLCMGRMVASSSPKCEDCFVVGLFNDNAHIAYCRVNSDKSWSMIEAKKEDTGNFMDVEIFNGMLYVRTDNLRKYMLVYDLQDSSNHPPKPKVLGTIPPIRPLPQTSRHENQIHAKGNVYSYLTRGYASGELLLVYLFHNSVYEVDQVGYLNIVNQYVSPPQITKCEVFKLDTSNNKWVKLDHLGDRVVFLGHYQPLVMSRSALNSSEELITENTIYFALYMPCSKPWLNTQLGRLCMTDNNIKYFSLEQFGHELNVFPFWSMNVDDTYTNTVLLPEIRNWLLTCRIRNSGSSPAAFLNHPNVNSHLHIVPTLGSRVKLLQERC